MGYILIFAAMGATYLPNSMTYLDAQEVADFGIEIAAKNFNREITVDVGPLFLEVDLSQFKACTLRRLGISIRPELEVEIFGATISEFGDSKYPFRLAQEHLESATITVACDSGPDKLDQVYQFKLGDVVQAP